MNSMANLIQTGEPLVSPHVSRFSGADLAARLLSLRQLLQEVAQSMCADELHGVAEVSAGIGDLARQTTARLQDLQRLNPAGIALCSGEELRRTLLTVVEARAFFVAALRRWRRAMRLRHASLQRTQEPAGYGEDLTRWA